MVILNYRMNNKPQLMRLLKETTSGPPTLLLLLIGTRQPSQLTLVPTLLLLRLREIRLKEAAHVENGSLKRRITP